MKERVGIFQDDAVPTDPPRDTHCGVNRRHILPRLECRVIKSDNAGESAVSTIIRRHALDLGLVDSSVSRDESISGKTNAFFENQMKERLDLQV